MNQSVTAGPSRSGYQEFMNLPHNCVFELGSRETSEYHRMKAEQQRYEVQGPSTCDIIGPLYALDLNFLTPQAEHGQEIQPNLCSVSASPSLPSFFHLLVHFNGTRVCGCLGLSPECYALPVHYGTKQVSPRAWCVPPLLCLNDGVLCHTEALQF